MSRLGALSVGEQPSAAAALPVLESVVAVEPACEGPRREERALDRVGACVDVVECPAHVLGEMPLPSTLRCVDAAGRRFVITTSRLEYAQAAERGEPAFVGGELAVMAAGVRVGRVYSAQLRAWLEQKSADAAWRLSESEAIGGEVYDGAPSERCEVTIGQVLRAIGAQLLGVEVHD